MRLRWILMAALCAAVPAMAQTFNGEVALSYNWMRGNTPAGNCNCFALNGGGLEAAWNLTTRWALAAEAGAAQARGEDLTLSYYLAGGRFFVLPADKAHPKRPVPFAQLLLGGAHASGVLAGTTSKSSNDFAFRVGGGFDVPLGRSFALRPLQAEYLLTLFPNRVNGRQNILVLGSGFVYRFGKRDSDTEVKSQQMSTGHL